MSRNSKKNRSSPPLGKRAHKGKVAKRVIKNPGSKEKWHKLDLLKIRNYAIKHPRVGGKELFEKVKFRKPYVQMGVTKQLGRVRAAERKLAKKERRPIPEWALPNQFLPDHNAKIEAAIRANESKPKGEKLNSFELAAKLRKQGIPVQASVIRGRKIQLFGAEDPEAKKTRRAAKKEAEKQEKKNRKKAVKEKRKATAKRRREEEAAKKKRKRERAEKGKANRKFLADRKRKWDKIRADRKLAKELYHQGVLERKVARLSKKCDEEARTKWNKFVANELTRFKGDYELILPDIQARALAEKEAIKLEKKRVADTLAEVARRRKQERADRLKAEQLTAEAEKPAKPAPTPKPPPTPKAPKPPKPPKPPREARPKPVRKEKETVQKERAPRTTRKPSRRESEMLDELLGSEPTRRPLAPQPKEERLVSFMSDEEYQRRERERLAKETKASALDKLGQIQKMALLETVRTFGSAYSTAQIVEVTQQRADYVEIAREETGVRQLPEGEARTAAQAKRPWPALREALKSRHTKW